MEALSLNWYALYVKSRHEFVTAAELLNKGIETFLPNTRILRQWKDRRKWVNCPVFPGYLFIHMLPSSEGFLNVLKTRGAVSFISLIPGHPTPVTPEEINSLILLIESGKELDIHPELKEGTGVRVRKGPLTGAEGILVKKNDQYHFVVNIDILGRSVSVKVYADDIEAT